MFRRRALPLLAAAVLAVPALSGCILVSTENPEPAYSPPAPTPASTSAGPSRSTALPTALPSLPAAGAAKDGSSIEDPCALLTRTDVIGLTARQVTQIDEDGLDGTAAVRYCQWQLSEGQLALFVTGMSAKEFAAQAKAGTTVDKVGDAAFTQSGHLFVLSGEVQVDIYARVGDDAANLRVAKLVAARILPRL